MTQVYGRCKQWFGRIAKHAGFHSSGLLILQDKQQCLNALYVVRFLLSDVAPEVDRTDVAIGVHDVPMAAAYRNKSFAELMKQVPTAVIIGLTAAETFRSVPVVDGHHWTFRLSD